jgi:hypothetical protein
LDASEVPQAAVENNIATLSASATTDLIFKDMVRISFFLSLHCHTENLNAIRLQRTSVSQIGTIRAQCYMYVTLRKPYVSAKNRAM